MKRALTLAGVVVAGLTLARGFLGSEGRTRPHASAGPAVTAVVPTSVQTGLPAQFDGAVSFTAGALHAYDGFVGNLRVVPATGPGGFVQGSPASEPCRGSETQFTHVLTRNLAVMEIEVYQGSWEMLRAAQPSLPAVSFHHADWSYPVEEETWYEAVLFANLLSKHEGMTRCYYTDSSRIHEIDSSNYNNNDTIYFDDTANGYRLPTEGEWEHLARAGTTGAYSKPEPHYSTSTCDSCSAALFGLESVAWYCANSGSQTHKEGGLAANPWGLYDVHGNVDEWCWDRMAWAYPAGSATDYQGPASGASRVARGGNYTSYPKTCRSASRGYAFPGDRYPTLGFRLVRSIRISYDWDFGDGTAHSAQQTTSHSYSSPGTYTWSMTATVDGTAYVKFGQIIVSNACSAATIDQQPQSQTISSGQTATLTVIAGGTAPFSDQWYQGESGDTSVPIGTDWYSFTTPALTSTTHFWVRVSNGCGGADSATATITVTGGGSGPTITKITSKTSKAGSSAVIYGSGFSTDLKKDVVYFGAKKVRRISKAKTTSLKITIPKVAKGTYAVTVVVNNVTSNAVNFTVK